MADEPQYVEITLDQDPAPQPRGDAIDGEIQRLQAQWDALNREEENAKRELFMRDDFKLAKTRYRIMQERGALRQQIATLRGQKSADHTTIRSGQFFSGSRT